MPIMALFRAGTLSTFRNHTVSNGTLTGAFINILSQRERDRVRPDLLPAGEVDLRERCKARRAISAGYREAQR